MESLALAVTLAPMPDAAHYLLAWPRALFVEEATAALEQFIGPAFVELLSKVEVVLFELADALVEGDDVGGGAEPGLAPGLFTERLREPFFQLGASVKPSIPEVVGQPQASSWP